MQPGERLIRVAAAVWLGVLLGAAGVSCGRPAQPPREAIERVALPAADTTGSRTLESVLASRRSQRDFAPRPLALAELGQLAWAAQGVTSEDGKRTSPSAGALYPLELYVATADGLFRYVPASHVFDKLDAADLRERLHAASSEQAAILAAPAVFVVTGTHARTAKVYGKSGTRVYVHLEAGHAAQNLLLAAEALDLAAVPMGGFDAAKLRRVLDVSSGEEPLYIIAVGHRAD